MCGRPNLGLFKSHVKDKGTKGFPIISPPFFLVYILTILMKVNMGEFFNESVMELSQDFYLL